MDKERLNEEARSTDKSIEQIKAELAELDEQWVNAEGIRLKPSQCYHFGSDPIHVLFNTNCPDELKEKVERIIARYK